MENRLYNCFAAGQNNRIRQREERIMNLRKILIFSIAGLAIGGAVAVISGRCCSKQQSVRRKISNALCTAEGICCAIKRAIR